MKPIKPIKAYAGMVDNKIHYWKEDVLGHGGTTILAEKHSLGIYKTKKEALNHYEEVIPVLISPIKPKKHV